MACDPTTLANDARCVDSCVPQGLQLAALIGLFCQIRDNGGIGTGGIQAGIQAVTIGTDTGTVTFATAFASAPVVVATVRDSSDTQILSASIVSVTTTGFTFNLTAPAETASVTLHWMASLAT